MEHVAAGSGGFGLASPSPNLPAERLLAIAAVVVVLFFSLSKSNLPEYVLPGVVALGILVARLFALAWERPGGAASRLVRRGALLMSGVSAAIALLSGLTFIVAPI